MPDEHKPANDRSTSDGNPEVEPPEIPVLWKEPAPPPPIPEVLSATPKGRSTAREGATGGASVSDMGRAWGAGLDFVFTTLAGAGLGWVIGRWTHAHQSGWTLGGLAFGFVLAVVRIIRYSQRQDAEDRAERERRNRP